MHEDHDVSISFHSVVSQYFTLLHVTVSRSQNQTALFSKNKRSSSQTHCYYPVSRLFSGESDEKKPLGERNEPSADSGREPRQSALHGSLRSHFHLLLCLNCSSINVVYILSLYKTSFYRYTYHVASRSNSLVSIEFKSKLLIRFGTFPYIPRNRYLSWRHASRIHFE